MQTFNVQMGKEEAEKSQLSRSKVLNDCQKFSSFSCEILQKLEKSLLRNVREKSIESLHTK